MKPTTIKIITVATFLLLFTVIKCACSDSVEPKSKEEIAKAKTDSLAGTREKKIDYALTGLKEMIKKNMKDPDSYEMIARTYDKKDTLNVVKLLIKFRGNNSFGGKTVTTVLANYDLKEDKINITKQFND